MTQFKFGTVLGFSVSNPIQGFTSSGFPNSVDDKTNEKH